MPFVDEEEFLDYAAANLGFAQYRSGSGRAVQ
jgi:hypothetical protein